MECVNQFVSPALCLCFTFTGINFKGILHGFVTWAMTKTCVGQLELVNVGAQMD